MKMAVIFAFATLLAAGSVGAQELYNPVPGALAVNAALEHTKGKGSASQDIQARRKAIRDEDFECRLRVVNAHASGSEGRQRAMQQCDAVRDAKLRALER
jgi:hypothetical protein